MTREQAKTKVMRAIAHNAMPPDYLLADKLVIALEALGLIRFDDKPLVETS